MACWPPKGAASLLTNCLMGQNRLRRTQTTHSPRVTFSKRACSCKPRVRSASPNASGPTSAESLDRNAAGHLGHVAIAAGQPHIAVMIGKRVARRGITLHAPYYPLHPLADADLPMAPEMNLAIARRESEFDPVVQSSVGARGLMQVMPGTGREVAASLGLSDDHTTARMISDPAYNAKLGATYLSQLARRFDGNVVLMSAAYNAGPSRPNQWMLRYGNPRAERDDFDVIDWIEHIPFRETRNYVMRVTESLPIYRARLGKEPLPIPFSEELVGSTLLSFAPQGE